MQSGLKILKIHPQPICQLQNCVEANKDLSRKYSNPNIDNPFQNQNTFLKTCQFTQKFWHQYWCFLVEMGVSKKVFFLLFIGLFRFEALYFNFWEKKIIFSVKLTSSNSGLAAWWGLMRTSTVLPTAQGSIPKTKIENYKRAQIFFFFLK